MSIIEKLTEGIVNRDMKAEGSALLDKWSSTGLLEVLSTKREQHTMARLLENQAKELLRESSSMGSGGNVEGFAAVAFPIVRRVFAGLIANDLVSVQPMSLPSGLIFFLDFTFDRARGTATAGDSIYGQGVVGSQITGGVDLSTEANTLRKIIIDIMLKNEAMCKPPVAVAALAFIGTVTKDNDHLLSLRLRTGI